MKKLRVKDSVKIYIMIFISIFAVLSLLYVWSMDPTGDLNKCMEHNTWEYCVYYDY